MCAGEAQEVGSQPADQEPPEEVRLRGSARSQLDQCDHGLHRPHTAVCPRRGTSTLKGFLIIYILCVEKENILWSLCY